VRTTEKTALLGIKTNLTPYYQIRMMMMMMN